MTNDQIVAFAASIGSCASAVATLWTVREIAKQRTASYRPELAVSQAHITGSQDDGNGPLTKWEVLSTDAAGTTMRKRATLAVSNVGLGAAKDLRFVFSFDLARAVATFNQLAAEGSVPAEMRIDEIGALSFKARESEITSMWQNQQKESSDYLLPALSHGDSFYLEIPDAYRLVVSALIYVWAQSNGTAHDFPTLPPLAVAVGYVDIADVQRTQRFVIEAQVQMIQGRGERFQANLAPKRSA